jgi:hypothetical protein
MKNLGAGSEVSSFGKELDFMAWFISPKGADEPCLPNHGLFVQALLEKP